MKKILGIVGSLRESGNSELMIKQICRELAQPHQLRLLRLPDFNLKYCNGCYRCLLARRGCVIRDDLSLVLDAICSADALILAAPTYFLAAHSCLKSFVDRGISFYARHQELWGKPAIGVGISGIEGKEGSTLLDIERFFATILAEKKGTGIVYGALPGETLLSDQNLVVARDLARALFSEPQSPEGLSCSLCGGQTFRFLGVNQVRCMLCSEAGKLVVDHNSQPAVVMEQGEHPLLSNRQDALEHRDWLFGMVGRFKEQKEALARVRSEFDDDTEWVKPA